MTPSTLACQAPLSVGFLRQEYCNGLPFPSPGDLPDLGIEPTSPGSNPSRFFITEPPGNLSLVFFTTMKNKAKRKKKKNPHCIIKHTHAQTLTCLAEDRNDLGAIYAPEPRALCASRLRPHAYFPCAPSCLPLPPYPSIYHSCICNY